jgi:Fe-S-cluster containining protein
VSRCTGHCCRRFYIKWDWLDYMTHPESVLGEDERLILSMIVLQDWYVDEDGVLGGASFGCRNLGADGNCAIYEKRPLMCRNYPYGNECKFAGCTLSDSEKVVQIQPSQV